MRAKWLVGCGGLLMLSANVFADFHIFTLRQHGTGPNEGRDLIRFSVINDGLNGSGMRIGGGWVSLTTDRHFVFRTGHFDADDVLDFDTFFVPATTISFDDDMTKAISGASLALNSPNVTTFIRPLGAPLGNWIDSIVSPASSFSRPSYDVTVDGLIVRDSVRPTYNPASTFNNNNVQLLNVHGRYGTLDNFPSANVIPVIFAHAVVPADATVTLSDGSSIIGALGSETGYVHRITTPIKSVPIPEPCAIAVLAMMIPVTRRRAR